MLGLEPISPDMFSNGLEPDEQRVLDAMPIYAVLESHLEAAYFTSSNFRFWH